MKCATFLCLATVFFAAHARSQVHPVLERGFAPDKIYRVGEVDSVNPFNGNLIVSLPLGPTYPVGGDLKYQLTLTYNSVLWDYVIVPDVTHPLCDAESAESPIDPPWSYDCVGLVGNPSRFANAGLGWRLSLGELLAKGDLGNTVPGWLYVAPDGSQHALVESLHESDPIDADVWYTRDSSYLRMKVLAYGGAGNPIKMAIEAPNGVTRIFVRQGSVWRLTKIHDTFGNYLKIQYFETYWKLTDSVGRVQKIHWTDVSGQEVVDTVELAAFDTLSPAVYQFSYDDPDGNIIEQSCKDSHFGNGTSVSVPLLSEVRFPDGSGYVMEDDEGNPAYYDFNWKEPGHTCTIPYSGILRRLVLPTGGVYEWEFDRAEYPTGSGSGGCVEERSEFLEVALGFTAGVAERKVITAAGQDATWIYDYPRVPDPLVYWITRTVTSPENNDTVHHFRTQACQYDENENGHIAWTGWDYGLPFNPNVTRDGRHRSVAFYKGTGSSRTLKRVRYVLYEHDQLPSLKIGSPRTWYDSNRRVAELATYYVDDGWSRVEKTSWSFDGLGHYRTSTRDGFGASGPRIEKTNFNPTRGTYSINAITNTFTGDFSMLPVADKWLLNTFDFTKQTEGGVKSKQEHCFNTSTGKLERTRTLKSGTSRKSVDLLKIFEYGPSGNMKSESYFGGDNQSLGTGSLCTLVPPSYEYRLNHSYSYGVRKKTTYGSIGLRVLDNDIDSNTGLVKRSRDSSGFATNWAYDRLGRVTAITPDNGARTTVTHTSAIGVVSEPGFRPASIDVRYRRHDGSATIAREKFEFDGLGRLALEKRLFPDLTWAERRTEYTTMGWPSRLSEWVREGGSNRWTVYSSYDPFGRAARVTFPDSKFVDFTNIGERITSKTLWIGFAKSGSRVVEREFTTSTHRDHLNRITSVSEPVTATQNVHTLFGYDIGGRLKNVLTYTPGGSVQFREMIYDNRGFLAGETMPEKGETGNGTVIYSNHDSRGHVGKLKDGPNQLSFTYDRAERLTEIKEDLSPFRVLETRAYATSNSGSDLRKGKLTRAIRHNFFDHVNDFKVDESYVYKGIGGKVSRRTTTAGISGVGGGTFTQYFTWDELGVLKTENYPRLGSGGSLRKIGPDRKVSYRYTMGFLTAVPGFADKISYHPSGMTFQTVHSNGVVDTRARDSHGMARPRQISTAGANLNWNSGVYRYDGAGNVNKIGGEWYLYDGLSRLVEGTTKTSAGSRKTRRYTYDGFGNLMSIWTSGVGTRTINVNRDNNRLTGSSYDAAGNQTSWGAGSLMYYYSYYPFNQVQQTTGGSPNVDRWYAYNAEGERIASFASDVGETTFAIRDLEGHVLREYQEKNGAWTWETDYVWGLDGLLATINLVEGTRHYTIDHLGSPRLVCDRCADSMAKHNYYPFGEEATDADQNTAKMKFTGHERDLNRADQTTDDLDYMHARHYNQNLGRFLSVDLVGGKIGNSQSFNRYSYVQNNPIGFVDPNGKWLETAFDIAMAGISVRQAWREPSVGNLSGAVLDIGAVVLPGVPAVAGRAIDAAQTTNKLVGVTTSSTTAVKTSKSSIVSRVLGRLWRYPHVTDVRTGRAVKFPAGDLKKVPREKRVAWGVKERAAFIADWHRRGYETPAGGWGKYDIHHIQPRELGGANEFWNLTPVERGTHQELFNRFWREFID